MRLLTGGGNLQKDERKEYMDLCNQMTSRKPDITIDPINGVDYKSIADKMIETLLSHTIVEINSLYEGEKKEQMLNDFETISASMRVFDDTNHIGRVNIFSLQVIILFTLNDVDYDPNFEKYDVVGSVVIENFQTLIEIDWKNYGAVRDLLTTPNNPISRLTVLYNKDEDDFIYLITLIDLFTLDELNIAFLNKNILCGISYTSIFADGRNMNPYIFFDHDIIHGQNYKYVCFQIVRLDLENVTKFYNYCRTYYREKKKKWYSIQVMIFLLIHESAFCDFFFERKPTKLIDELNIFIEKYFNNVLLNIERFTIPNDLDFVLSKELKERLEKHRLEKHRRGEEEAKERGDLEKDVKKYLKEVIIADYLNALDSWYHPTHSGGSKYKRKNRRTKRVSKRKRKNKKRSRRIYTLKI